MKRRTRVHTHRKKTHITSRRSKTSKHLRVHMIFVYSTMGIFVLTVALTIVQNTFEPFAFGNSSSQYVLGESISQEQTPIIEEKPFYLKVIDLFLP